MMEVSVPVIPKDEEVELDLGLSIGGSFRRSETTKPVERAFDSRRNCGGFDLDLRDDDVASVRSAESDAVESKTVREAHAVRRREARRKQREKRGRSATDSLAVESVVSHASESDNGLQGPAKREKTEGLEPNRFVLPVQYPHPQVQFVPYTRGLAYPCVNMIPYWTPSFPTTQKSAFRTVPCPGLRPFLAHPNFGLSVSQKNDDPATKTTPEQYSPLCSTSTVSDHHSRSSSLEVDGSSEARTQNSSQSSREQTDQKEKHQAKLQSDAQSACNKNTITDVIQRKASPPTKKPPRPEGRATASPSVFPEMPYVAARGDGPAGRIVTGLLYRYSSDSEITIVCVCHGTTFSPAEFVKHAGGTDVSHPLRHITVIPNPPL